MENVEPKRNNVATVRKVSRSELPMHCPPDDAELWQSHPRVYLPLAEKGRAKCPYCGAEYVLED